LGAAPFAGNFVLAKLEQSPAQLIDLIYSAVVGESTWQEFLSAAGRLFDDGKAILFYHDAKHQSGRFQVTTGFDEAATECYSSYYSSINCWMQKAQSRPVGIASHSSKLLPREQLLRTEFYNDFLRRQNIASGLGLTICRDLDCSFMLSVLGEDLEESEIEGRVQAVQSLMPHLQRASQFYRRGNAELGNVGGGRELDALSIGLMRIGLGRQITYMNDTAEQLLNGQCALYTDVRGRLACKDAELLQRIDAMSWHWHSPGTPLTAQPFILQATDHSPPMKVTLVPPPADDVLNFFRGPECTLLIERPRLDVKTAIAGLAKTSKLTSAEAMVVEGLASGLSIKDIAQARTVSTDTVRAQVKSVFAKTGLRSQADLIRHVTSLAG
jgi:DNA-binding CsgD family transcriptional regulator